VKLFLKSVQKSTLDETYVYENLVTNEMMICDHELPKKSISLLNSVPTLSRQYINIPQIATTVLIIKL